GTNPLANWGLPESVADSLNPPGAFTLYAQSGWQAARGEWTRSDPSFEPMDEDRRAYWQRFEKQLSLTMETSWIMTAYALVLFAAIIVGIALQPGRRRAVLVELLAGSSLILATMQMIEGFPLVQAYCSMAWDKVDIDRP